MSDLLLRALLQEEQNPLEMAGQQMMQAPRYFNPQGGFWQNFAMQSLPGIAGGLMAGYGKSQREKETNDLLTNLPEFQMADPERRAEMSAANPRLGKIGAAFLMQDQQREQEQQAKMQQLMMQEQVKEPFRVAADERRTTRDRERNASRLQAAAGRPANSRYDERTVEDPLLLSYIEKQRGRQAGLETEPVTEEEIAAIARAPEWIKRTINPVNQQVAVQSRYDGNQEQKDRAREIEDEKSQITGYRKVGALAPRLRPQEAAAENTKIVGMYEVAVAVDNLAKGNPLGLTGENAISNKINNALIINAFRDYTGRGTRVLKEEFSSVQQALIPTLAGGRTLDTVLAKLTARDKEVFARVLKDVMRESIDARAFALGRLRPGGQYTAEQLREFAQMHQATPEEIMSVITGGGQQ